VMATDSWRKLSSFAVVNDEHELVGLLYSKDMSNVGNELLNSQVADIMTPIDDVPNVSVDDKASHAYLRLDSHTLSHLPVFDKDSLQGTISLKDIVSWLKTQKSIAGQA
jgi:CBS domain-containing protein